MVGRDTSPLGGNRSVGVVCVCVCECAEDCGRRSWQSQKKSQLGKSAGWCACDEARKVRSVVKNKRRREREKKRKQVPRRAAGGRTRAS